MSQLSVQTFQNRRTFEPGDEISGEVRWELQEAPRSVELRLFWFTKGKGTEDAGVMDTLRFEHAGAQEKRAFKFRLPDSPYSFSGRLITLAWALELVVAPSKEVARLEFVMAPRGKEVLLGSVPQKQTKKGPFTWSAS
jgi:hypothetical protein